MYTAQDLFELVDDLRNKVDDAYDREKWANDAQFAQSYKQLAMLAGGTYVNDPVIGELQVSIPSELDALVRKDPSCLTAWVRMQVGRLAIRLAQLARLQDGQGAKLKELDIDFMVDPDMKFIVASDFVEAQRASYANAPKAAAVLYGSALEGMLVDVLKRPDMENDQRFVDCAKENGHKKVKWKTAGLMLLLDLAKALSLIRTSTRRIAGNIPDFRNTVHPLNEKTTRMRPMTHEANVLLGIVDLVAADLNAHLGPD